MRTLAIALIVLFVLLPPDAQMWLIGLVRPLWLSGDGRALLIGMLGATIVILPAWAAGWNALAAQLHQEDSARADAAYRSRKR